MTKPKSHKQPRKAGKHEKGAKPPEAVEAQAPAAEPGQPQLPVAAETPPEAASPPASEAPAAEPQAPESAQPEVATSTEPAPEPPAPEPAAPAKIKGKRPPKEPKPKKTSALDAAVKAYTELLKKDPGNADAAYNFEYAIRLRDTVSKTRPAPPGRKEDPSKAIQKLTGVQMAGDLPDGRTMHGDPGAPPPNTDMTQFKMHIPVRPDERQGGSDAGQGKQKVRKG